MPDGCFRKYFLLKVLYPWEAFLVAEPHVGQGEQDEDVAQETDGEDDDQVGDEEHLVVPDGLGHAILLLPSLACFRVRRGAVDIWESFDACRSSISSSYYESCNRKVIV